MIICNNLLQIFENNPHDITFWTKCHLFRHNCYSSQIVLLCLYGKHASIHLSRLNWCVFCANSQWFSSNFRKQSIWYNLLDQMPFFQTQLFFGPNCSFMLIYATKVSGDLFHPRAPAMGVLPKIDSYLLTISSRTHNIPCFCQKSRFLVAGIIGQKREFQGPNGHWPSEYTSIFTWVSDEKEKKSFSATSG